MTHQKLVSRKEHYENVLQEIKSEIAEYFLCEQKPPEILFEQERAAKRVIQEAESQLSAIDWILNN